MSVRAGIPKVPTELLNHARGMTATVAWRLRLSGCSRRNWRLERCARFWPIARCPPVIPGRCSRRVGWQAPTLAPWRPSWRRNSVTFTHRGIPQAEFQRRITHMRLAHLPRPALQPKLQFGSCTHVRQSRRRKRWSDAGLAEANRSTNMIVHLPRFDRPVLASVDASIERISGWINRAFQRLQLASSDLTSKAKA